MIPTGIETTHKSVYTTGIFNKLPDTRPKKSVTIALLHTFHLKIWKMYHLKFGILMKSL